MLVSLFRCRRVNQRLKDQIDRFWHTTNVYMNSPLHEYARKLTAKLPENLSVSDCLLNTAQQGVSFVGVIAVEAISFLCNGYGISICGNQ